MTTRNHKIRADAEMKTGQDTVDYIQSGRRVVEIETAATQALLARIDESFQKACTILM